MKVLSVFIAIIFSVTLLRAGDGIEFMTGNYNNAISKAKQEQKLILLDFTASWCFPCKKMERDVFPDRDLGEFVNTHFVSFKVDADYFWGMDIADKFRVKAYPTLLIIDSKGKEVKRIVGYQNAKSLLEQLSPFQDFQSYFSVD